MEEIANQAIGAGLGYLGAKYGIKLSVGAVRKVLGAVAGFVFRRWR